MPPEPTTPPAPGAPAPTTPPVEPPAPGEPAPGATPPDDVPPGADASDREKRRWAALSGRVTQSIRERDEARALADRVRWREIEQLAGAVLSQPGDIRLECSELVDLVDPETGEVDPARVHAALEVLTASRPGLAKIQPARTLPGGHALPPPGAAPTLADAVRRVSAGRDDL